MTVVNNPDHPELSALPMPITIEVSVGNDGATICVLPVWLHANYAWRMQAWSDQFRADLPSNHIDPR